MAVTPSCETCVFWKRLDYQWRNEGLPADAPLGPERGVCRVRSVEDFPERRADEWCGEHKSERPPREFFDRMADLEHTAKHATENVWRLESDNRALSREIAYLRHYGNKGCTALADANMEAAGVPILGQQFHLGAEPPSKP